LRGFRTVRPNFPDTNKIAASARGSAAWDGMAGFKFPTEAVVEVISARKGKSAIVQDPACSVPHS
jgi:hypothetical protein